MIASITGQTLSATPTKSWPVGAKITSACRPKATVWWEVRHFGELAGQHGCCSYPHAPSLCQQRTWVSVSRSLGERAIISQFSVNAFVLVNITITFPLTLKSKVFYQNLCAFYQNLCIFINIVHKVAIKPFTSSALNENIRFRLSNQDISRILLLSPGWSRPLFPTFLAWSTFSPPAGKKFNLATILVLGK